MKHSLSEMNTLDIYLSCLSNDQYRRIKPALGINTLKTMPLVSWDIFLEGYQKQLSEAKKRVELDQVLDFAQKFKWENDLQTTFAESDYEALILTDKNQNILWVNEGFTTMTGYSKKFALNKTPRFLQGENTSLETKKQIRKQITLDKPFQNVITNHRKDRSTYICEVKIVPLHTDHTTHFIAFERQVG